MSAVIKETSLYELLLALPENMVGEIINGELHTQPRPAGPHASATSLLGMDIGSAYQRGRGGPGGWWIIDEPEIHFVRDTEVLVPDIAGWRRERMPSLPQDHRFEVVPVWVCEVLSPSTQRKDRISKADLLEKCIQKLTSIPSRSMNRMISSKPDWVFRLENTKGRSPRILRASRSMTSKDAPT